MSKTAEFIDKDGDSYQVVYNPATGLVAFSSNDGDDVVAFHVTDGGKVIDGIKAAMTEAALGGTYDAGGPLTTG